jgi:purine-binding chemotaxis protein CheW
MYENDNTKQIVRVLSFYLHERLFSIPLEDIAEVNRITNIAYCEKAPDYVQGLINLHGITTPILNMKKLLNIEFSDFDQSLMWLSVKHDKLSACLAVDKLSNFLNLGKNILDETPTLADGLDMQYIKCFAKIDNMLIPVLNVAKIINEREKQILKQLIQSNHSLNREENL